MSENFDIDVLDQVIYDTIHNYRDANTGKKGPFALAKVVNMSGATLQNKANRNEEYANLNVKEARSVMLGTKDFSILHALAAELSFAAVPLPVADFPADMDLMVAITEWTTDYGETAAAIRDALNDKKITRKELEVIRKELVQDFEKGIKILDVMEGMAEPE